MRQATATTYNNNNNNTDLGDLPLPLNYSIHIIPPTVQYAHPGHYMVYYVGLNLSKSSTKVVNNVTKLYGQPSSPGSRLDKTRQDLVVGTAPR